MSIGLAHVDVFKSVFVRFEYDGDYGTLDAFNLHNFLVPDVAELFNVRS